MYYLELDSVDVDCDVFVMDESKLIMASFIDLQIKNKKAVADLIGNNIVCFKSFSDPKFSARVNSFNQKYEFKSCTMGDRTHTIIKSIDYKNYFIYWGKENIDYALAKFIQSTFYIPVTKEIMGALIEQGNPCLSPLQVFSENPDFKPVAYDIDPKSLMRAISRMELPIKESGRDWSKINNTEDYVLTFVEQIRDRARDNISVLYDPNKIEPKIFLGEMKPLPGQIPIIQSALEVLKRDKFVYLAATQGSGKTSIGSKINHGIHSKHNYVTLGVVPCITLKHWEKEIKASMGDVDVHIIERTSDFIKIHRKVFKFDKPTYFLVGKETFKLDSPRKPGVNFKTREMEIEEKDTFGVTRRIEKITVGFCPSCGEPLTNPLRVCRTYLTPKDFGKEPKKSNYKCANCQSVLWQNCYDKTKKSSLIRYIKSKNIKFDSIILDEVHQSNNSGSIIGNATRSLVKFGAKFILLSGTTNNGYSSSFHNLMMAFRSRMLKQDGCIQSPEFIKKYGTLIGTKNEKDVKYGYSGRLNMNESDYRESEGINPVFFTKYLAQNYIFSTLEDLSDSLPELKESYIPIDPSPELQMNESIMINDFKRYNIFNWKMYQNTIVRHYLNNPQGWSSIQVNGKDGGGLVHPRNMVVDFMPKDDKLVELVKKELAEGRKVCIYTDFTGDSGSGQYMTGTNIPSRIKSRLSSEGIDSLILHRSVKAIDRKEYIDEKTPHYNVLISNPKLVEVGVNLQAFTTYIVYTPNYEVNVIEQAIRRGYRINSTEENRIYHMYYVGTSEQDIIERYQLKKVESKAIESKFNIQIEDTVSRTASSLSKKLDTAISGLG